MHAYNAVYIFYVMSVSALFPTKQICDDQWVLFYQGRLEENAHLMKKAHSIPENQRT